MSIAFIVIHVIVCVVLICVVLLQTGKGADMGAAFGGGASQTLFGSTGATTFLGKATTVVAVVFMLTSLTLAYISGHRTGSSIMKSEKPVPVAEQPVPATDTTPIPGDGSTTTGAQDQPEMLPRTTPETEETTGPEAPLTESDAKNMLPELDEEAGTSEEVTEAVPPAGSIETPADESGATVTDGAAPVMTPADASAETGATDAPPTSDEAQPADAN